MRFAFTDDQRLFAKALRDLLARACGAAQVRDAWSREDGRVPGLWDQLHEIGVTGATLPEAHGGLGFNELDLVLLMEEAGRAACPEPLLETTAVAVPLLRELGQDEWLGRIGAGKAVAVVAFESEPLVAHAKGADVIFAERGGALLRIEDATCELQPSVDGSRRLYAIRWDRGEPVACPRGAIASAFDRAALAAAAELCGVAGHLLDSAVEYAKTRQQFGKPIGSFQAVKHQLANALLRLEFAKPLVYRAAYSMARGDADRSLHVSMAKAQASDAAAFVAKAALQIHGAIGYSYELDLHLWLKRAWALAAEHGDATWHRARVGRTLGVYPEEAHP